MLGLYVVAEQRMVLMRDTVVLDCVASNWDGPEIAPAPFVYPIAYPSAILRNLWRSNMLVIPSPID